MPKIKLLQVINSRDEIDKEFSPDNVYYIKPLDEIEYYREPFVQIWSNGDFTIQNYKTHYEEPAFLMLEGDIVGHTKSIRLSSFDTEINGENYYCWKGVGVEAIGYLTFTRENSIGEYSGTTYYQECTENDGVVTPIGEIMLDTDNSSHTITNYIIEFQGSITYGAVEGEKINTQTLEFTTGTENITKIHTGKGMYYVQCDNCNNLTDIVLGEGLNGCSFKNCTSLTRIEIPSSVDFDSFRAGRLAFEGCTNLTVIVYNGDSVPSDLLHPWGAPNGTWVKTS
jgi:hypothetical protein